MGASAEGSRAKERELPQGLERGVAKFCQGSEEERTGWSNEGFFLLFFFQSKRDHKELEARRKLQREKVGNPCGEGKFYRSHKGDNH